MRTALGRATLAAAMLLLVLPSFATAAGPSVWLVPGGGYRWIPNELGVEPDGPQFGGILGFRLASSLALEARGNFGSHDSVLGAGGLDILHGEGNLTWFVGGGAIRPYLTAGAGAVRLSADGNSESRFAWNAGMGFAIRISDKVGLRIDGRDISYKVFVPSDGEERFRHGPEIFGGISLGFGGGVSDEDRDGVRDKVDQCPGTPVGARIDANGCPIDGDGDGVPDGIDKCDGTQRGATVDAVGCPADTDSDGVLDGIDKCSATPAGARVDANGCPADSDNDGVFDGADQCDGTPTGCTVNTNGCPSDSDNDGVCDGIDTCPDTPTTARVDQTGCPIRVSSKETELLETGMIRLQDVNFDTGKATIKADSYRALDEVGDILTRWPELRIEIAGHTDSRGSDARNQTLSDARAKSVLEYLLNKFPELRPERFTSRGYGETSPIASNTTTLGMAKNRRVEFRVLNKDVLKREREQIKFAPKE
ncbi:MAG TPA: OmpA family protein [Candidatus Eisenbacteria bacterium]|nr:OmpA family protein [Candidatus Eisenbacteria bacterium]